MSKEVNSMPKRPALGKGEVWTAAKCKAVLGKNVLVGWEDAEAEVAFVYQTDKNWDVKAFFYANPKRRFGKKHIDSIDGPEQIIKIYDTEIPNI